MLINEFATATYNFDHSWGIAGQTSGRQETGTGGSRSHEMTGQSFLRRPLLYCAAGTLSVVTAVCLQSSTGTSNWNINPIRVTNNRLSGAIVTTTANDLALIRAVMRVSVSELSRIFDVSRQSIHDWLNGGNLSVVNMRRVSDMARVATIFAEANVQVTPQVLRRSVGGSHSIRDALLQDQDVVSTATQLVTTLRRETEQRDRLAARLKDRMSPNSEYADFGLPLLDENA